MGPAEDVVGVGVADEDRIGSTAPGGEGPSAHDDVAFHDAHRHHLAEIWRYVRRRTDGPEDADDVTAEVFAVAWRRRHDLPPVEERRLWLFGVARRVLANQHRSARRRQRLHLRLVDTEATAPSATPGPGDDPAAAGLWAALATLSHDDRELLLLRSWDGLPVQDLAVLLGCTPNAASLRLHKARGRLADALASTTSPASAPGRPSTRPTDPPGSRTSPSRSPHPEGDAR